MVKLNCFLVLSSLTTKTHPRASRLSPRYCTSTYFGKQALSDPLTISNPNSVVFSHKREITQPRRDKISLEAIGAGRLGFPGLQNCVGGPQLRVYRYCR